jgi:hypothetical protein
MLSTLGGHLFFDVPFSVLFICSTDSEEKEENKECVKGMINGATLDREICWNYGTTIIMSKQNMLLMIYAQILNN